MKSNLFYVAVSVALAASFGCEKKADTPAADPATATQEKPAETNNAAATNNAETTAPAETAGAAAADTDTASLANVDPATLTEEAPAKFSVKFETTAGDFTVDLTRAWAPTGVDRFYNLVKAGYYQDIAAFRVIDGFMAQFGIHGDPAVNKVWREAKINDDPRNPDISNKEGYLTFAHGGPNTRTVQLFINYRDNGMLDSQGFPPIGKVAGDGMKVVNSFHKGYGEGAPRGKGPDQMRVQTQGNEYLKKDFPELTYIKSITLVGDAAAAAGDKPAADKPTAAPAKAWKAGAFQVKDLKGAGIEGGAVKMKLNDDGSVAGSFQGRREGKAFSVPFKGSVDDKGKVTAKGDRGGNTTEVHGMVKGGAIHGNLQGAINKNNYRITFKAE